MGVKRNEVTKSFAQWTERAHFSVTFDPGTNGKINGSGVVDRYDGQTITNDEVPVVTPNGHYIFKGWNPEFTEHTVTGNETYTAVYEYVAATVHFNTGENGESIDDIIVDRGSRIDNVPRPRHRSGIFVGWYSDSGLQNAVDLSTWKMPSPAVETTFYAKWDLNAAKRVVSYVVNGGTASFTSVVKVLTDSGWASTSGSFTLAETDIPTVTADATHEGDPTWSPRNPLGAVLSDATTFTATFAEKRVRVQVIGNEHVDITNGDQTVVIGSTITPIVVKPKSGWGYGYGQANLTALSGNGLTAIYSGYDNSITISGSLSADTTLTAPTCGASGDLTVVYVDNETCAEIVGAIYSLRTGSGGYVTINGSRDIPNSAKIYGLTTGTNIVVEMVSAPEGYGDFGVVGEHTVKGVQNEIYVIYSALSPTIPSSSVILEIHQNVVGSESSRLDTFRYNVTLNNELYNLHIRGTRDAKLRTVQESNAYNITQIDENSNGYITSVVSGSLSGAVNTNSGVSSIVGIKHLKGSENNGSLLVKVNTSSDMYINQKLTGTVARQPLSCEINVELSDKTFNNDQFVNGVGVFKINNLLPGQSGQIIAEGLPTCGHVTNGELTSNSWPEYVPRYINRVEENTIGQIMNTTRSTSTINFNYNQATVLLTIDGENILNQSSTVGISLHDDQNVLLEDITDKYGSYNVVNGQCVITNAVSKFGQTLRFLQVPCARLNIFADTDSLPWYGDVEVYKDGSIIDHHTTFVQLEDNTTYNFNIKYSIIPGVAKPDPNCNIADVQINGVSVESGVTTFDWNQSLKLIYKNPLQTGGLNALWAAFGETEYTDLVTTSDASVSISSSEVEATWSGLGQDQYDLANSLKDTKPFLQIYDENGLPSQFVIINIGCTQKKILHPDLTLNIDVSDVGGGDQIQHIDAIVKETQSAPPFETPIYIESGIGNPAYITNNFKPFESIDALTNYTSIIEVYLHTESLMSPEYGKVDSDCLYGWTRFSDGETVKYIPNYLSPITDLYKNVRYKVFGMESGAKTIDVKGQPLIISGDHANPADYQADSPINRPWPDPNNEKSCPIIHGDTLNFLITSIDAVSCAYSDTEETLKFDIIAEINNYEMYKPDRYDLERIINDRVFKDGIGKARVPIKGIRVVDYTYPTQPVGNELGLVPYTITCAIDIVPNLPGDHYIVTKNMVVFNDPTRDEDNLDLMITVIWRPSSGGDSGSGGSSGGSTKSDIPTDPETPPGMD